MFDDKQLISNSIILLNIVHFNLMKSFKYIIKLIYH